MGVTDAPAWLSSAFVRSCVAAGATAPREEVRAAGERLIRRWQEPGRHFHDLRHVVDVLARVDELAEETHRPDVVRLAAWYHGAVFSSAAGKAYARSGGEDETASAELAREELLALGVPQKNADRVHRIILNLRRHDADHSDVDCLALCDADLATLAVEPQRYEDYRRAVREEYAHIPLRDYLEARIAIISRLLDRRKLFLSPMGAQWEEAARENLTAELDRLRSKLAGLGPREEDEHGPTAEELGDGAGPPERPSPGTPDPAPGVPVATTPPEVPVETVEARALRTTEPRPSSLESVPEELGSRQASRPAGYQDPERARRVERARIAEVGRARVEQAVREGARTEPSARDGGAPRGGSGPRTPPVARPERSPVTAPSPDGATEAPAVTPPPPRPTGSPDAAEPAPPRPEAPVHGMERDPELLDPVWRRRRRRPRSTGQDQAPRSTGTGPPRPDRRDRT